MKDKILVIGGTGFIGSYVVDKLIKENEKIKILAYSGFEDFQHIEHVEKDITKITIDDYLEILKDVKTVIYAAGVDDRATTKEDPTIFFYNHNVKTTQTCVEACIKSGVSNFIILSSYFLYFNNAYKNLKLAETHPYINSRFKQAQLKDIHERDICINVLLIPYVFGKVKHGKSLFHGLIQYCKKMPVIFFTPGGTNVVSVNDLADAICNARFLSTSNTIPIQGKNLTWKELFTTICKNFEKKPVIITIPKFLIKFFSLFYLLFLKMKNEKMGLNAYKYLDFQCLNSFYENEDSFKILNYSNKHCIEAINETAQQAVLKK